MPLSLDQALNLKEQIGVVFDEVIHFSSFQVFVVKDSSQVSLVFNLLEKQPA